jgi:MFS-type transporter involved in bile tolerance (Atg22 family)
MHIFKQKQEEWRIVFIITAVIYLIGAIILLIFTKGTVEPWAVKSKTSQKDHEESVPLKAIE